MNTRMVFFMLVCAGTLHAQDFWEPVLPSGFALSFAANSQGYIYTTGFYRSTNGGTTWALINSGLQSGGIFVAVNPLNDDLFGSVGSKIFRSTNNGDSWTLQDSVTFHADGVRLTLNNQGILFGYADTLRRSTDNGITWTVIHSGLPFGQIPDLRVHPNGNLLLARKGDWLFRSTDNGNNWIAVTLPPIPPPPGPDADAIAFGSGDKVYVGDDGLGFLGSTNGGSSWTQLNNGLPNTFVWALAVTNGGDIFAGMANGGVYRSTNGGAQWDSINTGLNSQSRRIYSLFIAPSGHIFAGTTGGIYRSAQRVSYVGEGGKSFATQYSLSQNYPNPCNPNTTIRYQLPQTAVVVLRIYDILGQEVATLVNREIQAGNYDITWNAGGMASGVYFYQIHAGDFVQTRKLILIR
ncbi:MAG: T9SS type A sorting domain-containing protein [Bacteroidetes bacterium]|nr:T9SS type A sorting domain-containing protein [Bacteroidota bacterium]MCW5896194.1 T9SS type A sorting domain-containing protein [Bacteroidota bacterium]